MFNRLAVAMLGAGNKLPKFCESEGVLFVPAGMLRGAFRQAADCLFRTVGQAGKLLLSVFLHFTFLFGYFFQVLSVAVAMPRMTEFCTVLHQA